MEFEILQDLIKVITPDKLKRVEVLGNEENINTPLSNLYKGISEGRFSSDEDAARAVFGQGFSKNEYRKLRVRLIRQLVNTTFFVDLEQREFNERGKYMHLCNMDFASAQTLAAQGAYRAAIFFLNRALDIGVNCELMDLSSEISRMLRIYYSDNFYDRQKYNEMVSLHENCEERRCLEIEALGHYEYIITHYMGGRSVNNNIYEYARKHLPALLGKAKVVDTALFYYYIYCIEIIQYSSSGNYREALYSCQKGIDILRLKSHTASMGMTLSLLIQKVTLLTQLREFDESAINEFNNSLEEGVHNWFVGRSTHIPFFIAAKKYDKAFKIFTETTNHPRFNLLSGINLEIWKLYAGYLQLLAALDQLNAKEVETTIGKFKPTKFSNDFLVLNKEKGGMNIPILLLPIIFSIVEGRFLDSGRSVEALKKYRLRYLENDINQRSASFMKMLLALSEMQHAPEVARKKILVELEKLKQEPIEMSRQSYAIEVIPYDDLWALITQKIGYPELSGTGQ